MTKQENPKPLSVREAGKRGGDRVKEKYGPEYFQRIGKLGGKKTHDKYGSEHYREIGAKGGTPKKEAEDVLNATD